MNHRRIRLPRATETEVLTRCHRRCCLCFHLENRTEIKKGQIAHLNRNPSDNRLGNLVWLCLEHHDAYDSRASQSKGYTEAEVRLWRDRLIAHFDSVAKEPSLCHEHSEEVFAARRDQHDGEGPAEREGWRYPLWQVADQPDLFAYSARNGADGVCVIERIDLPDGRIVVACIEVPGNPGNSITNSVESICAQVCRRFELPPDRIVWLENYDYINPDEWEMVIFGIRPPLHPFGDPVWVEMTPMLWRSLGLEPRPKLATEGGRYLSKLTKHFAWPGPQGSMLGARDC